MSKLNTPVHAGESYSHDDGVELVKVLDANGFWLFDCFESDANEIIKRINGFDERQADAVGEFEPNWDVSPEVMGDLMRENRQLEARIAQLENLCGAAECPQCGDKSGAFYDGYGEVQQCQWCDELNETPEQSTAEIQADAVDAFLPKIKAMPEPEDLKGRFQTKLFWRGAFAVQQLGVKYADHLRQQAKGSESCT